jgi:PAS domain S-box-containing protein
MPTAGRALAVVAANALGTFAAAAIFLTLTTVTGSYAGWVVAATVAVAAANAVATPAAIVRWWPTGRALPVGSLRLGLAYGLVASVVDASLAVTVVIFLRTDPSELWLLAGPAAVAVASYRAWLGLRRRHARVEFLLACSRLLGGASSAAAMLDDLLALTRDAFHADEADLRLDEGRERRLLASVGPGDQRRLLGLATPADPLDQRGAVLGTGGEVLLRRGRPVPGIPTASATVDAVVARLSAGGGRSGTITVSGRMDGRRFDNDDLRLLAALAASASAALTSSRMIEDLGASVADLARLAALVVPLDEAVATGVAVDLVTEGGAPDADEHRPMAVGIIDGEFTWRRVNAPLGELLGAAPAELEGQRFERSLAREDIEPAHGLVSRLLRGESRGSAIEVRCRRPGGDDVVASFLARPLLPASGEPRVLCVLVDITAQRREDERQRDLEAQVNDAILDLTFIRHPEAVLAKALQAARQVTGAAAAVARLEPSTPGTPPAAVDGPDPAAGVIAIADPERPRLSVPVHLAGGRGVLELVREPGAAPFDAADEDRARRLAAQATVSLENAETHGRALALVADLDEANAALHEASETRSRFLANVSHELRTPLHAILIAAQLLADPTVARRDPDRARALPGTIDRTGRHLLRLIEDLVDLARIELRDLRMEPVDLDLSTLLEDVRRSMEPLADDRGIHLAIADATGIRIHADAVRLRQVLLNLLGNAIKYTPSGGRVRLEVGTDRDGVRIRVHDTGCGIAPADLDRAFVPFERLVTDGTPGAGLGLPIARTIMDLHGGSLHATSAPGIGSVFTAYLPAPTEPPATRDAVTQLAGPAGSGG